MSSDDEIRARFASAISNAMAAEDEMVTKWICLAEAIDDDGRRAMWLLTDTEAKPWDTLGMLTFAVQQIQADSMPLCGDDD